MSKLMNDNEFKKWVENDQGDPEGDLNFAKFKEEVKNLPAGKREKTLVWKMIRWELSQWKSFLFKEVFSNLVGLYLYTWDRVTSDSNVYDIPYVFNYGISKEDVHSVILKVNAKTKPNQSDDFPLIRALLSYRLKRLLGRA
jgi:hypothetical protein